MIPFMVWFTVYHVNAFCCVQCSINDKYIHVLSYSIIDQVTVTTYIATYMHM